MKKNMKARKISNTGQILKKGVNSRVKGSVQVNFKNGLL